MTWYNQIQYAAEDVYDELGPGHSESIYENALDIELMLRNIASRRQVACTIKYRDYVVGSGYIDILVEEKIILEIKAVAKLSAKDEQQVRKYMTATGSERGLLINFGNDLEIVEVHTARTKLANGLIQVDFEVNPVELKQAWEKGDHEQTPSSES